MKKSKKIVYWVTRGYKIEVDENSDFTVDQYMKAIDENGISGNGIKLSLETVEANSECVHFESCIVEVEDTNL